MEIINSPGETIPVNGPQDIDLIDYIRVLLSYKWFIFLFCAISITAIVVYDKKFAVPIYESSATFLLPSAKANSQAGQFSQYAGLLGINTGGNSLEDLIEPIFNSKRMEDMVVLQLVQEGYLVPSGNERLVLKPPIRFSSQDGVNEIRMRSNDPKLAQRIVAIYISKLSPIVEDLKIENTRVVPIILDHPDLPKRPVRPRLIVDTVLTTILSFIFACGISLSIEGIRSIRRQLKAK